jgi:hypothetical protein
VLLPARYSDGFYLHEQSSAPHFPPAARPSPQVRDRRKTGTNTRNGHCSNTLWLAGGETSPTSVELLFRPPMSSRKTRRASVLRPSARNLHAPSHTASFLPRLPRRALTSQLKRFAARTSNCRLRPLRGRSSWRHRRARCGSCGSESTASCLTTSEQSIKYTCATDPRVRQLLLRDPCPSPAAVVIFEPRVGSLHHGYSWCPGSA